MSTLLAGRPSGRSRHDDWLGDAVPIALAGRDRQGHVWLVRSPQLGRVTVKRFESWPLWQRLASWLQLHPAQRERRMSRGLASRGLPVLPVIQVAAQRGWLGDRLWLARPVWGRSLDRWLAHSRATPWPMRHRVTDAIARLITRMLDLGLVFTNLATDNLVVGKEGQVWINDLGGVRRSGSRRLKLRMLATLDRTAARHGATRPDRLRCLRQIVSVHRELGELRGVAATVARMGQAR